MLVRWSLQRGYACAPHSRSPALIVDRVRRFVPLPKSAQPARVVENAELYDFELSVVEISQIDALDQGDAGGISWNPVNAP